MTYGQLFKILRAGELKNVSDSDLAQSNETVFQHVILGVIELYKRFPINYKEKLITLEKGKTTYDLPNDILTITAAYDGDGALIGLNESSWYKSVFVISPYQIQIPFADEGEAVAIVYKATYTLPKTDYTDPDDGYTSLDALLADNTAYLPIPDSLVEALCYYVGWRAREERSTTVPTDVKTFYDKFEQSCARASFEGMATPEGVYAESIFRLRSKNLFTPHSDNSLNHGSLY